MAWAVCGACPTCKRPMWSDGIIDPKTDAPRVKLSCDCARVTKDKILAPIVIPERDRDIAVRDCEKDIAAGREGHVVAPMNYPLPEPSDQTKRDFVFERVQCLKCESNIILQLQHNPPDEAHPRNRPPRGVTILNAEMAA